MGTTALDVPKLKLMAVERWRAGGGDTLVKVYPTDTRPDPGRTVGYCTSLKFVVGRTPEEMEAILGFRGGTKLREGAEVFRVDPLPSPEQFELRGYTNTPAGVPQVDGVALNPDYPPGLGAPQWELVRYPQSGLRWLASVAPGQRFACRYDSLPSGVAAFISDGIAR